ncbi:hypothetical protein BSL78_15083 [Apostichopus japonicus]|uniref:Uncharacterized protein n=1 Tax=Stichopus japonicus TaxID=307972 RepID=A0A2G8KJ82_STIJA|nr:hypothetical protein BSL78_15083 [Apostichopus japonicus]
MLKIGSFGEDERDEYIEKVYSDDSKAKEVKELIDNVPFILDLCNVPLLFVLLVHNIDRLGKLHEGQLDRVTPFVKAIVDILCSVQDEEDTHSHLSDQKTYITLEELAFNGLCKGNQQLFWQKDFVDRSVTNSKAWIDSGILVVEEGTPFNSTDRNLQTDSGSGTPQTDSISDESLTHLMLFRDKRGVSPDPDLSASVSQSESKPILESKEKKSKPLQKGKAAKYVSLQVDISVDYFPDSNKCLKLSDVVEKITEKALILKADVSLGVLNTLRAIEVNRWDQKLINKIMKISLNSL